LPQGTDNRHQYKNEQSWSIIEGDNLFSFAITYQESEPLCPRRFSITDFGRILCHS